MDEITIDIAKNFSRFPAGRTPRDSAHSGEDFREKHLVPYLNKFRVVKVLMDGTVGYGSSFLDEAFGGLMRTSSLFDKTNLEKRLQLVTFDPNLSAEVWSYIKQA